MDKYYVDTLNEMYNNGEISLKEKDDYYQEFLIRGKKNDKVLEKINSSPKREHKDRELTDRELTDRELQEQILQTLKLNQRDNRTIKFWVVFWSWLSIIGLVIYLITLLAILR